MSNINQLVYLSLVNEEAMMGPSAGVIAPIGGEQLHHPKGKGNAVNYGNYHHVGASPFRKVKRVKSNHNLSNRKIVI